LTTVVPTRSPLIWTTIATGRRAEDHGIRRFKTTRIVGLHRDVSELRNPRGFHAEGFTDVLRATGRIFDTTVTSADRRAPAFWQIASSFGSPVSVINWWATWPAEPTLGAIVSERIHFGRLQARGQEVVNERLTYPEALYEKIRPLVLAPDDVRLDDAREFLDIDATDFERMRGTDFRHHVLEGEFKYIYSMFETDRRIALGLLEQNRNSRGVPDDLWVLFRIIDLACHSALQYSVLAEDHLDATPDELRKYGRMVTEAYRHADRAVGEIVRAFGPGNVVIVSDHGFELGMGRNGEKRYVHNRAPEGIFIASGPAIRPGRVEGLSIHEVLPLVLYLKDFPVAEDFAGRVPLEVVDEKFLGVHPMLRIASYGGRDGSATEIEASQSDEVMLERLRALGYIQ
ncbi:MAG: alkaline phosphatase family protein, partial [Candidatus Binatia bacterium]